MKKGGGENFLEEVFSPAPPFSRTFKKQMLVDLQATI
jgi:hypothetical protein